MPAESQSQLNSLTPRQRDIYEFLKDKILNRGYGPTVREIGNEFGIRSPNGVMCHLKALEKKGLITRESHMSRAIQLTSKPSAVTKVEAIGTLNGEGMTAAETTVDLKSLLAGGTRKAVKIETDDFAEHGVVSGDVVIFHPSETWGDGINALIVLRGEIVLASLSGASSGVKIDVWGGKSTTVKADKFRMMGQVVGVVRTMV